MGTDVVDWNLALATGTRFAPKGPDRELEEARETVAQLRSLAAAAVAPVRECTGLITSEAAASAVVVDRRAWIESNLDSFRYVLSPVLDRLRSNGVSAVNEIGSRLTAVQMGFLLGWLSGKVLGQYEALVPPGQTPRLMLVAPNIVQVADTLGVDQRDFQLWVCLHEETHRVQFNAVGWLPNYFAAETRMLVAAVDVPPREFLNHGGDVLNAIVQVLRGNDGATALMLAVLSPEQRGVYDRISALMTLLEGHADVVMDEVGPEVVPSVELIRSRFDERRNQPGSTGSIARRLFGMDAKLRQYTEGGAFVRSVVDEIGMGGFNEVWAQPANLPSLAEIAAPQEWIRRIHG